MPVIHLVSISIPIFNVNIYIIYIYDIHIILTHINFTHTHTHTHTGIWDRASARPRGVNGLNGEEMGGADNGGSPLTYRANTTMIRGSYEENNVGKIVKFYSP